MYREQGFTLVELLVALAVGTIVIAGAYGSYDIVAKQYEKIEDVSAMHTASRSILRMLKRDIQMAGFEWRDSSGVKPFATISGAYTVVDSQNSCCDKITVIYDDENRVTGKTVRVKITYSVATYNDRKRLYRQRDVILPLGSARTGAKAVLADYVEDLQFTNPDSNTESLTGYVKLNNSGKPLAAGASSWSCVQDTSTGLIWETKTKSFPSARFYGDQYLKKLTANESDFQCFDPSVNQQVKTKAICTLNNYIARINASQLCGLVNWKLPSESDFTKITPVNSTFFPRIQSNANYMASDIVSSALKMRVYRLKGSGVGAIDDWVRLAHPVRLVSTGDGVSQTVGIDLVLRSRYKYEPKRLYTKKSYTGGNYKINVTDAYKRSEYSTLVMVRNN